MYIHTHIHTHAHVHTQTVPGSEGEPCIVCVCREQTDQLDQPATNNNTSNQSVAAAVAYLARARHPKAKYSDVVPLHDPRQSIAHFLLEQQLLASLVRVAIVEPIGVTPSTIEHILSASQPKAPAQQYAKPHTHNTSRTYGRVALLVKRVDGALVPKRVAQPLLQQHLGLLSALCAHLTGLHKHTWTKLLLGSSFLLEKRSEPHHDANSRAAGRHCCLWFATVAGIGLD